MSQAIESALVLPSGSNQLMAIVHQPPVPSKTGVLVVVGGPQYRVGSHRQFVQLSRQLAADGISSMRFDYSGMGDSEGDKKSFEQICDDMKAACDALCLHLGCQQIVIWGLCDAASAAMIYAHQDPRVKGMVLLNPWLRSSAAMGKTMLKYYYLQRLFSKQFWQKLWSGKVNVAASIGDAKGFVKDSVASQDSPRDSYPQRMQRGLAAYQGELCLILSGVDLTAKEFEQQTIGNKQWKTLQSKQTTIHRLSDADHTFSTGAFKREVEAITSKFVTDL